MIKISFRHFMVVGSLLLSCVVTADETLEQQAAQQYNSQQWSAAIDSYLKILKDQPDSERAWYRLSQSYLQINQADKAMKANQNLSAAKQIPKALVLYQKAQALALSGQEQKIWSVLDEAVAAGFSNVNDLKKNSIWENYREQDNFKTVMNTVDQNVRPCVYGQIYDDFDFWLGEWEVYGNPEKTGPMLGRNTITKTEQGCLIMEHWQGASGSSGTSMNYYEGLQQKWVQRWVSSGVSIDYAGGLIENDQGQKVMRLVGQIYYASKQQQPQIRDFRGTWTPLENGVVQQFFEESVDGGKTWYVWFNGFYFPATDK